MSTLVPTGWNWFVVTGSGTFWPAPTDGNGQGAAAGSPTGQIDLDPGGGTQNRSPRCILGGYLPLKKLANGAVTLIIRKGDGTTATGLTTIYQADAANFIPKSVNFADAEGGGLELAEGLSANCSSNDMSFLIWYKLVKSNYVPDKYDPAKFEKSP